MKKIKSIIYALLLFACANPSFAQVKPSDDVILKAMKDELARNMIQLRVENLADPFFISYTIRNGKTFEVKAKYGSIIMADEFPLRSYNLRVMVGGYQSNDENFFDLNSLYSSSPGIQGSGIPKENDYDALRRALWLSTDNIYKRAAEQYERKKAAIKQQSVSKEIAALPDFTKADPVKSYTYLQPFNNDRNRWESTAKEISALFKNEPEIHDSEVRIYLFQADEYQTNSEGTEIIKPLTLASVQINAFTQADDGEELFDHHLEYAFLPDDLPSKSELIVKTKNLIEKLKRLRTAPVFDGSYSGPVLFENEAAAELIAQRFFRDYNGLLAIRKPFVADQNALSYVNQRYGESLEGKIDKRIITKGISISALPLLKDYNGKKLIGFSEIDQEGVKPPSKVPLVDNGILKNLLSNRIPTLAVANSNGHSRPVAGSQSSGSLGAGVIDVSVENGLTDTELKKELIQAAKDEGLEYGIIVRKIKSIITGSIPGMDRIIFMTGQNQQKKNLEKAVYVYKLFVKDGHEELIRSVEIDDPSISSLKHILGASNKRMAYNCLMPVAIQFSPYNINGIPSSFITPTAILFEDLEVRKEKRSYTPKPPSVNSPLLSAK